MPVTYNLIASNTLSSNATTVTFSAIPQTFTDLIVRATARQATAFNSISIGLKFNTGTTGLYSYTILAGEGTVAYSIASTNTDEVNAWGATTSNSSASTNTFGSTEVYIPNYRASTNKQIGMFGVTENNAAATYTYIGAGGYLFRSTSAITQIEINQFGNNFVAGSSFFLYGIKNS